MQNMGFAYAMIPVIRKLAGNKEEIAAMLTRHLQLFNSNPYLSGPILGSVAKLEMELSKQGQCLEADNLKRTLMAPFAAIGDSLFWGSLKPFSAILAVILCFQGWLFAPLVFLILYNSLHLLVRFFGMVVGYKNGKGGIDFIRILNLPQLSRQIRWISVINLGILAYFICDTPYFVFLNKMHLLEKIAIVFTIFLCFWLLRQGASALKILYGASVFFILINVW
jgi:PTS system mannose-specific IID component